MHFQSYEILDGIEGSSHLSALLGNGSTLWPMVRFSTWFGIYQHAIGRRAIRVSHFLARDTLCVSHMENAEITHMSVQKSH